MLQRLHLAIAGNWIEQLYANRDRGLLQRIIIAELVEEEEKLSAPRVLHGALDKVDDGVAAVLLHWAKAEVACKRENEVVNVY